MNYAQSMDFIEEASKRGSILGLESMTLLLDYLGNPQDELDFIHIAGTNGKGSVLAYLSSILQAAGYRTGRYSSPSVYSYCEKFQIDQVPVSKQRIAKYMTLIQDAMNRIEADGLVLPTVFEIETAAAFLYFKEKKCDIVILETGMGGSTDATNVIRNTKISVITPIGMDHMEWLGEDLEKISEKKAGIIKQGCITVSAVQDESVMNVIEKKCLSLNVPLIQSNPELVTGAKYGLGKQKFSYGTYQNISIQMSGIYQIDNAVLALDTVTALRKAGYHIEDSAVREGMNQAAWPGRFEIISKNPYFIVDGAHNKAGAKRLAQSLQYYFSGKKIIYIFGVFADKEYPEILKETIDLADCVITVATPQNVRAMPAYDLACEVKKYHRNVTAADSLEEAVEMSRLLADTDSVIVAFGTLSFIGKITQIVQNNKKSGS